MLAVQFLLTARFRRATSPYGIDVVYLFHRFLALVGTLFILAHPILLVIDDPARLAALNPFRAGWPVLAGEASILALLALVATSVGRKRLRLHYDAWRAGHLGLALAALGLAFLHMEGAAYYAATGWKRALWLGVLGGAVAVVLYVRLVKPWRLLRRPWRVVAVRPEAGDAWTLVLEAQGHDGLRFDPGQFAWLTLRSSPFAMREHPFSIASSAATQNRVELTIKELGDFTRTIGGVRPGEVAYLEGPHGSFTIDRHPAPSYIFIAGGVGIVPIMSMLRTLADRGDRRPLLLIYGTSTLERTAFRAELAQLAERLPLRVVHVLEEPPESWPGERGRPDEAILARHLPEDRRGFACFLCGPTSMTRAMERALFRLGVPIRRMHSELFDLV